MTKCCCAGFGLMTLLIAAAVARAGDVESQSQPTVEMDVLMKAMSDEMARAVNQLQLGDLARPYFLQLVASDIEADRISATYGALTSLDHSRSRRITSIMRVGDYEFDNANFASGGGGFGGRGPGGRGGGGGGGGNLVAAGRLPLEDDYMAIRESIWLLTDDQYKGAAETLDRKRAFMKDKNITDKPADFTRIEPVVHVEAPKSLQIDAQAWAERTKGISAVFKNYPEIIESGASLFAGCGTDYIVTSEGTHLRTSSTALAIQVNATAQSPDGMTLSDSRVFFATTEDALPSQEAMVKEVKSFAEKLIQASRSEVMEAYLGPVLFEGRAAAQFFDDMLAERLEGRQKPLGASADGQDWDSKLGRRVMSDGFTVYDDPAVKKIGDLELMGHYEYDDEAVAGRKVMLVEDGKLVDLLMSRTPSDKLSGSNGHGRMASGGRRAPSPSIANLFVSFEEGLPPDRLKARLLEECRAQDLEFGLKISELASAESAAGSVEALMRLMQRGGGNSSELSNPLIVSKVYVADGREEPVRGLEFRNVNARVLTDIVAASNDLRPYNFSAGGGVSSSIVAPSILVEEMDLRKVEQEFDKPPLLESPNRRAPDKAPAGR